MSYLALIGLTLFLGFVIAALALRRRDLERSAQGREELELARERKTHRARLQYPHIDLTRCMGCGTCVRACPEEGVLDVLHGQAVVVHGARCVGHGRCAAECPVGAIAITLGDLHDRRDIPALTESLEAVGSPGIFLAGEVTGYALVRTAILQGSAVASEVARRARSEAHTVPGMLDLCIVGAGPAGIACALEAKAQGLDFVVLEQEGLGGTVSKYPRRKLVMTQPVVLPLHGRLSRTSYTKEELMELWHAIASEHALPIVTGQQFEGVERDASGLVVRTKTGAVHARNVCLALGRRGTPRKLGVPGEELSKVSYSLLDAQSYEYRRVLVVGGGDSAVEAALGLADQPGNEVTIAYRQSRFTRLKARNEARLTEALADGRIRALYDTQVTCILPDSVELAIRSDAHAEDVALMNDEVFIMAGGVPPQEVLERSGVSFDPALRPQSTPLSDQGTGFLRALGAAFVVVLCTLAWTLVFSSYYRLAPVERPDSKWHDLLRPGSGVGLALGVASALLVLANLAYLVRRSGRLKLDLGSLQAWMTSHVATGLLAFVFALAHSAMSPKHTVGGHALALLAILVITGAIGRYFYAYVPHATNGRELELDEIKSQVAGLASEWDRENRGFSERVRAEIQDLVTATHWQGSLPRRVVALVSSQRRLRRTLARLSEEGRREGLPREQLRSLMTLARRAHRAAMAAAHYEELRALLASWRYLHRWIALLMVLLVALHVVTAVRYAGVLAWGGGS